MITTKEAYVTLGMLFWERILFNDEVRIGFHKSILGLLVVTDTFVDKAY